MATWNQLPKPKFSDKEIAACRWLEDCGVCLFLVDLKTKGVTYLENDKPRKFASLVEFAESVGWNPESEASDE